MFMQFSSMTLYLKKKTSAYDLRFVGAQLLDADRYEMPVKKSSIFYFIFYNWLWLYCWQLKISFS